MVTTPREPEADPARLESAVRSAVAGHPQGAVRRILLYCVVGAGLFLAATGFMQAAAVAAVALIVLATTDMLS